MLDMKGIKYKFRHFERMFKKLSNGFVLLEDTFRTFKRVFGWNAFQTLEDETYFIIFIFLMKKNNPIL